MAAGRCGRLDELVGILLQKGTADDLRAARKQLKENSDRTTRKKQGSTNQGGVVHATEADGARCNSHEPMDTTCPPKKLDTGPEGDLDHSFEEQSSVAGSRDAGDDGERKVVITHDDAREHDEVASIESEAEQPAASDILLEQMAMSKPALPITQPERSTDERFVDHWWKSFTVHAVRAAQLKCVANEAGLEKLDVLGWLERVVGSVISGYTIVVVPLVQDKRVFQLVPVELSRPAYVDQMQDLLRQINERSGKKKQ